ncbi:hypothetical protein [Aeromonas cavernicola]|uniref:DUF2946 domain-containing protein n=1 Tax=Aeromonas cavernicola TaxID=1006623 RepID=A0A2H9U2U8_9GAMM|nr:hypothetical protein [Aeromonas cavernicola]PJG58345.1 hypothetical protein CUC53_12965 [Aeromonas cavernicola]
MGRIKFTIWIVLLGWLWLQPALAQHPLEAGVADHDHHCLMCALHLDGNQALPPSVALPFVPAAVHQACHVWPAAIPSQLIRTYPIRAPPTPAFMFPSI